jgi:hypothetical protein
MLATHFAFCDQFAFGHPIVAFPFAEPTKSYAVGNKATSRRGKLYGPTSLGDHQALVSLEGKFGEKKGTGALILPTFLVGVYANQQSSQVSE